MDANRIRIGSAGPLSLALALILAASTAAAQAERKQGDQGAAKSTVQAPSAAAAREAEEILHKTLAVYQNSKSYQGSWTYLMDQGGSLIRMRVELRSKGPTRLLFHLRPAANDAEKDSKSARPSSTPVIPEMRVVLDGKTAWFENATAKVYYKVALPKNPISSPLMFFPQVATAGAAERGPDEKQGDRQVAIIFAETKTGGLSRMEIDKVSNRIVRIANEEITGFVKTVSTLTISSEVFDEEIADSAFSFKAIKGFKEIAAPPDAGAVFGFGTPEKPDQ